MADRADNLSDIISHPENYSPEKIKTQLGHDHWSYNRALNTWEYATGKVLLNSFPLDISLTCVSNACNADCVMCKVRKVSPYFLDKGTLTRRYGELLPYCAELGLVGWGEPLINPYLPEVFNVLGELCDKRCNIYLSTNGILLKEKLPYIQPIIKNINVSLNAADPEIHAKMMGTDGKFETVVSGIDHAIRSRGKKGLSYHVNISVITTCYNIGQLPDLIRMAEALGVDSIIIRPLHPYSISAFRDNLHDDGYDSLYPENLPDYTDLVVRAVEAIQNAKVKVVSSDPRFSCDSFESIYPQNPCFRPYTTMVLYRSGNSDVVQPCCFIDNERAIHGFDFPVVDDGMGARDAWNGSFYQALRRSFLRKKLIPECIACQTKI